MQEVEKICYDGMLSILNEISQKFPSAKVIVTGYFQEISPNSKTKFKEMINWFLPYIHAAVIGTGIKFGGIPGGIAAAAILTIGKDLTVDSIIANWYNFHTWSTFAFHKAVWNANDQNPCKQCPFKGKRISFADPKFGYENAAFAKKPFLYGFKKSKI